MELEKLSLASSVTLAAPVIIEGNVNAIIFASGNTIQSVSLKTGKLLGTFHGHHDIVTCILKVRTVQGDLQILSCSLDGNTILWKLLTNEIIMSTIFPNVNILKMLLLSSPSTFTATAADNSNSDVDKMISQEVNHIYMIFAKPADGTKGPKAEYELVRMKLDDFLDGKQSYTSITKNISRPKLEYIEFKTKSKRSSSSSSTTGSTTGIRRLKALITVYQKSIVFYILHDDHLQSMITYDLGHYVVSMSTVGVDAGGSGVVGGGSGTGSIAIGQENGQIVILSNISQFLKAHYRHKKAATGTADAAAVGAAVEAEVEGAGSMIIRSVYHWHAHPVFSVAYAGAGRSQASSNNNSHTAIVATASKAADYVTTGSGGQGGEDVGNPRILYSGGEESVLVIWQLSKNTKNFLPRLGAAIVKIIALQEDVVNSGRVMVITADNTIRLVNTANLEIEWAWQSVHLAENNNNHSNHSSGLGYQMKVAKSTAALFKQQMSASTTTVDHVVQQSSLVYRQRLLQHLSPQAIASSTSNSNSNNQQAMPSDNYWYQQVTIHPATGYLLTNGAPGILQEYAYLPPSFSSSSTTTSSSATSSAGTVGNGSSMKQHTILQYHRISKKDPGNSNNNNNAASSLYIPVILHYDLDDTGMCLVTIDVRKGEELPKEYSLKFWEYSLEKQVYVLIAQMNSPHGYGHNGASITAMAISHTVGMTIVEAAAVIAAGGGGNSTTTNPAAAANNKRRRKNSEGNLASAVGSGSGSTVAAALTNGSSSLDLLDAQPTALLVATASLDGTVKVWQRLSSMTAAMDGGNKTKASSSYSNSMRYKCLYSFCYRPGMVISKMSFSQDNSTLAIPYGNLVTFWDPLSVQLQGSIAYPSMKDIQYLAFIEPRASQGQGYSDEVYIVLATSLTLAVYSLMSLQEVWSIRSHHHQLSTEQPEVITAIAVAKNEEYIITAPSAAILAASSATAAASNSSPSHSTTTTMMMTTSSLEDEVWIAIATMNPNTSLAGSSFTAAAAACQVRMYSPISSRVLAKMTMVPASTQISSLSFMKRRLTAVGSSSMQPCCMGLLALTTDQSLMMLQPKDHEFTDRYQAMTPLSTLTAEQQQMTEGSSGLQVAQVKVAQLPTITVNKLSSSSSSSLSFKDRKLAEEGYVVPLPTTSKQQQLMAASSSSASSLATVFRLQSHKDWLRMIIPENTEDLPRVSEITSDLLGNLAVTAAASASATASAANNHRSLMIAAEAMASNNKSNAEQATNNHNSHKKQETNATSGQQRKSDDVSCSSSNSSANNTWQFLENSIHEFFTTTSTMPAVTTAAAAMSSTLTSSASSSSNTSVTSPQKTAAVATTVSNNNSTAAIATTTSVMMTPSKQSKNKRKLQPIVEEEVQPSTETETEQQPALAEEEEDQQPAVAVNSRSSRSRSNSQQLPVSTTIFTMTAGVISSSQENNVNSSKKTSKTPTKKSK